MCINTSYYEPTGIRLPLTHTYTAPFTFPGDVFFRASRRGGQESHLRAFPAALQGGSCIGDAAVGLRAGVRAHAPVPNERTRRRRERRVLWRGERVARVLGHRAFACAGRRLGIRHVCVRLVVVLLQHFQLSSGRRSRRPCNGCRQQLERCRVVYHFVEARIAVVRRALLQRGAGHLFPGNQIFRHRCKLVRVWRRSLARLYTSPRTRLQYLYLVVNVESQ